MEKRRLTLLSGSWRYFDLAIVVAAVALGLFVWFIPSLTSQPEVKKLFAQQAERKAEAARREAELKVEAAKQKAEQEELGLVYIPVPPPKAGSPAEAKAPAKSKGK